MRLFIAAPIPEPWRQHLRSMLGGHDLTGWAPTDPDGWHLTVRFIGERQPAQVHQIKDVLHEVCASTAPYALASSALCAMPADRPRMIWLRSSPHGAHRTLHLRLSHALDLPPDDREPFWPHVTLARSTAHTPAAMAEHAVPGDLRVDRLALYESRRGPDGMRYMALLTLPLSGTAPTAPAAEA